MKKLFAIILALAMTFALSATALAEEGAGGTIKIEVTTTDGSPINGIVFTAATGDETPTTANGTTGADGKATIAISDNSTYTVATPTKNGYVITADTSNQGSITFSDTANEDVTLKYTIVRQHGKITVDDAVPGQTYSIYEMFRVETYTGSGTADDPYQVVYTVVAAWAPFFAAPVTTEPTSPAGPGYAYIHLDDNGHPTWQGDAVAADFAAAAIAWAQADPDGEGGQSAPRIQPTATKTAEGPGTGTPPRTSVEFTNLELGYYLVDSSLGALCSINTMHPNAVVKDKNTPPTVDKTPEDTESGVGDTVTYTAHIYNIGGQTNVLFTDTMTGLEFVSTSLKVYEGTDTTGTPLAAADHYTLTTTTNGFTVKFEDAYTRDLAANTTITLVYDAKVTDAAVSAGADNKAEVTYGEHNSSTGTVDSPDVLNTSFEIKKHNSEDVLLAGAKFQLKRTVNNTTETAYWKVESDGSYILEGWGALPTPNTNNYTYDIETNATANVELKGLGAGTYTLNETEAPTDYNLITDDITVTITYTAAQGETPASFATTYKIGSGSVQNAPVEVLNQKGGTLPGVGGIGTTIFYIIGGLLMVGAAVLLIVRKKMSVMD